MNLRAIQRAVHEVACRREQGIINSCVSGVAAQVLHKHLTVITFQVFMLSDHEFRPLFLCLCSGISISLFARILFYAELEHEILDAKGHFSCEREDGLPATAC